MSNETNEQDLFDERYTGALALLHECCSEDGFWASPSERDNYRRLWARDEVILGLATDGQYVAANPFTVLVLLAVPRRFMLLATCFSMPCQL